MQKRWFEIEGVKVTTVSGKGCLVCCKKRRPPSRGSSKEGCPVLKQG